MHKNPLIYTDYAIASDHVQQPDFCRNLCYNRFISMSGEGEITTKERQTRRLKIFDHERIIELRICSAGVTYWSDIWCDKDDTIIDPQIESLTLQNNNLTKLVIEEERPYLRSLDLSANIKLKQIYLPLCNSLSHLRLNRLPNLETAIIGNKNHAKIEYLDLRFSKVPAGFLSSLTFSPNKVTIDWTGANIAFNQEDRELVEYLQAFNQKIIGDFET